MAAGSSYSPPGPREPRVRSGQSLADRHGVQHRQARHGLRMVHCHPVRHQSAPIMPGDREPLVAKAAHQGHDVLRHAALAVGPVLGIGGRLPDRP